MIPSNLVGRKSFLQIMACGTGALLSTPGGMRSEPRRSREVNEPLIRRLSPQIRLFPAAAEEIAGAAELDANQRSVTGGDSGCIVWNAVANEGGEHEVYLSYAAPDPGFRIEVQSGTHAFSEEIEVTDGIVQPAGQSRYHNFERIKLRGRLQLDRGVNPVTIRISGKDPGAKLRFRCLEIVPPAATAELADAESRARAGRAGTGWLVQAGYGVKFTWADTSQPERGPHKPYAEAVRAFNVKAFADLMEETGAGYVLFQLNRSSNHCPAPIRAWEAAFPGQTTSRDLIGEVAEQLGRKGIRLLLYINSATLGKLGKFEGRNAPGSNGRFRLTLSEESFVEIHRAMLTEIGLRYGEKLAGYWFDSVNPSLEAYPNIPFEDLYGFCKAGNPKRLASFNFWMFPVLTPWQDYWAGELYSLCKPFPARYIQRGPGSGLQAHGLVTIVPGWIHDNPAPMPSPQFSAGDLITYVKANMSHQAATTINVGVYQEGSISSEQRQMMRELRRAVRGT